MPAPGDKMQLLRKGLLQRFDLIKSKVLCADLSFANHPNGEFELVARWPDKVSRMYFDRVYVLGNTASQPPLHQRLAKGMCSFARDAIIHFTVDRGL
jgi:hypothetical protein